jgi:hypothetical protein
MRIATFFCEVACIHIPAVAVEPGELLCPSSDPALQDVETPGRLGRALALIVGRSVSLQIAFEVHVFSE